MGVRDDIAVDDDGWMDSAPAGIVPFDVGVGIRIRCGWEIE